MKRTKAFVAVALIVACDGGAPSEPTPQPAAILMTSVDTLRPGQVARVRGSGLSNLRSLKLDGVEATELVARSDSVAEFRVLVSVRVLGTGDAAAAAVALSGARGRAPDMLVEPAVPVSAALTGKYINWIHRPAVIAHITSVLGIEYADLTDRHMLASVTAGLIDPSVVHDLPRYTSWDHSERARVSGPLSEGFAGRASRRVSGEYTLAAADGGHAAIYLMGDGPRGVSVELISIAPTARIVRLTRLR